MLDNVKKLIASLFLLKEQTKEKLLQSLGFFSELELSKMFQKFTKIKEMENRKISELVERNDDLQKQAVVFMDSLQITGEAQGFALGSMQKIQKFKI